MAVPPFASSRQHTTPEIQELRNAITFMDCLSQSGFSKISAIAKLTLAAMETPQAHLHHENIANVLRTIWEIADEIHDCINDSAEEVGCDHSEESHNRRHRAYRAAMTQQAKENHHA